MSKTTPQLATISAISPLSTAVQSQIRGGMAATDEEKRRKIKGK